MEKNTVLIDLNDYNKLRDFRIKIEDECAFGIRVKLIKYGPA